MKIVIFRPILIKISLIILLTDANSNAIQLCFHNFFNLRIPKFTNCKKQFFCQKTRKCSFFANCGFWASPIKKIQKAKLNAIKISISQKYHFYFYLSKSAEKCQFQNTRKFDASTPLNYPVPSTKFAVIQIQVSTET